jgi:hypothetical protein
MEQIKKHRERAGRTRQKIGTRNKWTKRRSEKYTKWKVQICKSRKSIKQTEQLRNAIIILVA